MNGTSFSRIAERISHNDVPDHEMTSPSAENQAPDATPPARFDPRPLLTFYIDQSAYFKRLARDSPFQAVEVIENYMIGCRVDPPVVFHVENMMHLTRAYLNCGYHDSARIAAEEVEDLASEIRVELLREWQGYTANLRREASVFVTTIEAEMVDWPSIARLAGMNLDDQVSSHRAFRSSGPPTEPLHLAVFSKSDIDPPASSALHTSFSGNRPIAEDGPIEVDGGFADTAPPAPQSGPRDEPTEEDK